jgi:enoyl-CoA hydratase/carnithine racemase
VQDSYTFQEDIADLVVLMRRCPQPIIAAVNGAATGGGLSIALASDIRIGTENARFACSFLNLGLSGCDVGSSYHLPKIVGASHAADMIYSGRIVDAHEAKEMGLITRIVPQEDLLPTATAIAGHPAQVEPHGTSTEQGSPQRDGHRHLAGERAEARKPQPNPRRTDAGLGGGQAGLRREA